MLNRSADRAVPTPLAARVAAQDVVPRPDAGWQQRLSVEGDVEAAEQADQGERAFNRVAPGDADQVAANSMPVYATPLTRACRTPPGTPLRGKTVWAAINCSQA
jgi:hypothetical protein